MNDHSHRRIQELHLGGGAVERQRREWSAEGASVEAPMAVPPPQKIFLHFHVEMAHFGGILSVNFIFYSMNKTVKNTPIFCILVDDITEDNLTWSVQY